MERIEGKHTSEALTYHVLNGIRAMNPRTVVVEEVVPYSKTSASILLRTVLKQMGYHLSETIGMGMRTKRKRWCLVANHGNKIALDNLMQEDGKVIGDFLEKSTEERNWKA